MELAAVKFEVGLDSAVLERASQPHDIRTSRGIANIDNIRRYQVILTMYNIVKLFQIRQILQLSAHFFLDIGLVGILLPVEIFFNYYLLYCSEVVVDHHLYHVDSLVEYGLVFLDLVRRHLIELAHVFENVLNFVDFFDLDGGAIVGRLGHAIGLYMT